MSMNLISNDNYYHSNKYSTASHGNCFCYQVACKCKWKACNHVNVDSCSWVLCDLQFVYTHTSVLGSQRRAKHRQASFGGDLETYKFVRILPFLNRAIASNETLQSIRKQATNLGSSSESYLSRGGLSGIVPITEQTHVFR